MKLKNYYKEDNYIHYSNCHEDFLLLKKYITPQTKEVLSVASGLDNSLAFLTQNDIKVHAFDYNPSQVYLGKLKIEAIRHLSWEEMLKFLGIIDLEAGGNYKKYRANKDSSAGRVDLYNKISAFLEPEVKNYFDSHLFLIEIGLVNCGRFEQYFHIFRNIVFPLTCGNRNIKKFAAAETIEEQREIYRKKINTKRFKFMFKIFFSKKVMAKLGRDKKFFKYSRESLSQILKVRVDTGFTNVLNRTNPYYGYVLNTYYPELPYYLQKENFYKIKENLDNITVEHKRFDEMFVQKYDFMNLSDIFEYMSDKVMDDYMQKIQNHLNEKGIVAFWNMMNVRSFPYWQRINGKQDYIEDRAYFYRDFLVYEK